MDYEPTFDELCSNHSSFQSMDKDTIKDHIDRMETHADAIESMLESIKSNYEGKITKLRDNIREASAHLRALEAAGP